MASCLWRARGGFVLLSVVAGACATTQVEEAPVSHEATLRAKLEQARALRTSGHGDAALSVLDEALKLEARWALTPEGELRALRDAEIAGAGETIDADLRGDLNDGAPLSAQKHAAVLAPLLAQPPLRPLTDRMHARIAEAGKVRCAELAGRQKGDTPYLARLLVDYCARTGGTFQALPPPEQRRGLRVSGRLAHMTEAQHRIVEAWLADVFRASPWYAADAPDMTDLQLAGAYDARLERRFVTLTVPYRTTVHSKVSDGLLGDLGPTANVDMETDRIFEYQAERYDARYGLDATLTLEVGASPPLVVTVKHTDSKRAFEHDVRFPPANVYPQRANLPDVNAWLTTFLGTKRTPLLRKLRERWVKSFCTQTHFSPEEAARCLQAGQRLPAAERALAAVFGGDTQAVVENITRPRADERKPEPKPGPAAKPAPEIQDIPPADLGSQSI